MLELEQEGGKWTRGRMEHNDGGEAYGEMHDVLWFEQRGMYRDAKM